MMVFALWYYLRYQDYGSKKIAIEITLLKVSDLAILVYIINYFLIPEFLYKKKYANFIVTFILLIFAGSLVKVWFMSQIMHQPGLFSLLGDLKTRLYENVISDFFLVIAGAAFKLIFDFFKMQQRLTEVAKEKAETELNFLKSQINPHFLFNSLNTVYFLIDKNNQEAREALHKFSDMLRYQLYEANGEKIPIEKEIGYLKDYVDLQKLRKDENYQVLFNCAPEVIDFSIEPLLLIPFVENAFKHISNYKNQSNFIKVEISSNNGEFRFMVENSKEAMGKTTEHYGGIGLDNVRRRLELLYPERHVLKINFDDRVFNVELKIKI